MNIGYRPRFSNLLLAALSFTLVWLWLGVFGSARAEEPAPSGHDTDDAGSEAASEAPHAPGAHAAPGAEHAGPVFVTPPREPTEVAVGMYLISLVEISAPSDSFPSFKAEIYLDLEWEDPRLAFDPKQVGTKKEVFLEHEAELELERIWWPDVEFENEQGQRKVESRELVIDHTGHLAYSERFQGVFVVDMHLIRFPFDHQNLTIHMESFAWDKNSVVFKPLPEKTGYNENAKTLEWKLHDAHTEVHDKQEVRSKVPFSELVYSINVDRDPGYYLYKIVLPLLLIVAFNWATFWMPGEPASTRMERSVIALLTVVAFHQVVSANLPRIGYLTFMDGVVYVAFASVGLTMLSTVWAQRQEHLGNHKRIEQMDAIGRVVYPVVFLIAVLVLWFVYHG